MKAKGGTRSYLLCRWPSRAAEKSVNFSWASAATMERLRERQPHARRVGKATEKSPHLSVLTKINITRKGGDPERRKKITEKKKRKIQKKFHSKYGTYIIRMNHILSIVFEFIDRCNYR